MRSWEGWAVGHVPVFTKFHLGHWLKYLSLAGPHSSPPSVPRRAAGVLQGPQPVQTLPKGLGYCYRLFTGLGPGPAPFLLPGVHPLV